MRTSVAVALVFLLLAGALHAQTTLYEFEAPAEPSSSLVDGGDGYYYGTTRRGGSAGKGTIYKVDLLTGQRTTIVAFNGTNGSTPYGDLVSNGSFLYGTTSAGGTNGMGTVYKVDRSSGKLTTLVSFNGPNGAYPYAGLVFFGSDLYGTTAGGGQVPAGAYYGGTIFKIDPSSGALTTVVTFGPIAYTPLSPLLVHGSYLYGVTSRGPDGLYPGGRGRGFKFEPATGALKILDQVDGNPYAGLIGVGPYLYGTATGGANLFDAVGCVFRIDPANDSVVTIARFDRLANGADPVSGLASDGKYLYGTAEKGGGADGWGTVFRIDLQLHVDHHADCIQFREWLEPARRTSRERRSPVRHDVRRRPQ